MSSFNSLSPMTISFKSRRKSSSTSAIDTHVAHAPSSSPPPSSSPLLTPLHLARSCEWQVGDYFELDGAIYNQRDKIDDVSHSWSRYTRPEPSTPYIRRSLPSLITKFAPHTLWGDALPPYSPSSFSSTPQITYFHPQEDSAIADDCEEYDLESMNIHIHETYFATSAERGRWLSSPIVSRARSQAALPMRGHSSPLKTPADSSPLGERLCRRPKSCTVDEQISTSFSEEHDEGMRYSSSLPPSSPLSSPLSNISFLGDDCDDEAIADPCSYTSSDDCHSFGRTPELSTSSTTCTSPVKSERPPTPHGTLSITSALHPPDFSCQPPDSNPRHSRSSNLTDSHPSFELDAILSPLSQFELDLPEAEPLKLPLSDMENKIYPGQCAASPGVTVDAVWSHSGPSSVQFNPSHQPLDISMDSATGANSNKKVKKKRADGTANPETRRPKKRVAIRSGSPSSDTKKRGAENHTSNWSEPPSKKSRVSRCKDDFESCANPRPGYGGKLKVERLCRSPSHPPVECCDSTDARDRKISQPQQPTPVPVNAELHASLTGMLIEAFASSRATSMDSAALYLVLTQAHPYLATERPKQELLMDIATVLEAGRIRCGMFEKVDSSGERSRHKALESRWFYIPERDEDEERASLISAIMPRQKRSETKKYKQYYYRPLDKISRWDPEDAA